MARNRSFFYNVSICNQNQSISILVTFRQNSKVIALLFAKNRSFLYNVSICNQNQSISIFVIFRQNTKVIALLFGQKSLIFLSCFNLQSKSINVNVGQFSAKYQGYSLTLWPKIAHFHHFPIYNQNQSISMLVSCRQNTKVIALLFGQKSNIFITFQSAIKINQFQCWSSFGKIPRL